MNDAYIAPRAQQTVDDAGAGGTGSASHNNKGLAFFRHALECIEELVFAGG